MNNVQYYYDFDEDVTRTIRDRFVDALVGHFSNAGSLVLSAPKDGGDIFTDEEFTHGIGDFVFDSIVCDGNGVDIIRGHVAGELGQIFEGVGGLMFDFDITAQGRVRHRYIDAERQVRDFNAWYDVEEVDADAIRQMEERWEKARLK